MGIRGKADRYAFRLMKRGGNSVPGALAALAALLVVAAPAPLAAAAAPQEYDLTLPGAGSGGGSEGSSSGETTAPTGVVPTAPAVTSPTTIESTDGKGGGKKQRKPDRSEGRSHPVLTASAVNATAGPQEVPPLKVESDEGGMPTVALVLAFVAAACCILALWRLRLLRELPAAPRPRAPRAGAST
jgi:hypothetical protein